MPVTPLMQHILDRLAEGWTLKTFTVGRAPNPLTKYELINPVDASAQENIPSGVMTQLIDQGLIAVDEPEIRPSPPARVPGPRWPRTRTYKLAEG